MGKGENAAGVSRSAVPVEPVRPEELVHERVRRFMKLLREVLSGETAEAVHDLRVWSRKLQLVLMTMIPNSQSNRADPVIQVIRETRRALSGWRDCDVTMALLDTKLPEICDPDERKAWEVVRAYLAKKREKEIRRVRRRLAKRKLSTLAQRTERLLKQAGLDTTTKANVATEFLAAVLEVIKAAYADWQAALSRAAASDNPADTHNFRIKTKQLRYAIELYRDSSGKEPPGQLNWLKCLQDTLGRWHDQTELARIATKVIAETKLLVSAPRPACLLLKRLAKEVLSEANKLRSLLASVTNGDESAQLEAWVSIHTGGRVDV
jgi:CHAD domain-containing protein